MTGWSAITFETVRYGDREEIPNWRDYVNRHNTKWPYEQLAYELFELADSPHTVTTRSSVGRNIISRWGGYRDWEQDEAVLEELSPLVTKAVVVQANDTTDTGTARLYQRTSDGFVQTDEYAEQQGGELHVGEKAASYMHATHGIPALANTRQRRGLYHDQCEVTEADYL